MKAPTLKELDEFTIGRYIQLLNFLKQNYKIIPCCEVSKKNVPHLILRHDVDWSLPAALKIAKLEYNLGIKSSYFILLSHSPYNILEEETTKLVRAISKLGHEIGLHYYPPIYLSLHKNMKATLKNQLQILEQISGKKVISISRHGPWDRDPFANIKGLLNANHPFVRGDLYVHDSMRAWAPLNGLLKLLSNPPRKVQLLTHCENWQDDIIDRKTLFKKLLRLVKSKQAYEQRLSKYWFKDPAVLEYINAVKNGYSPRNYDEDNSLTAEVAKSSLSEREYYGLLVKWYLINTRVGWQFGKMLDQFRSFCDLHGNKHSEINVK